jgi:hypothetical protein
MDVLLIREIQASGNDAALAVALAAASTPLGRCVGTRSATAVASLLRSRSVCLARYCAMIGSRGWFLLTPGETALLFRGHERSTLAPFTYDI